MEYVSEQWGKTPTTPKESYGLLRKRTDPPKDHPTMARDGWCVRDARSARDCGLDLSEQIRSATPELRALLDRENLLAFIRAGAKEWWVTQVPELAMAFVIADEGASRRLVEILDAFDGAPHEPRAAMQSTWLRRRAAEADADADENG